MNSDEKLDFIQDDLSHGDYLLKETRKLPRGLALLARVARLRLKGTIDDQRVRRLFSSEFMH